LPELVEAGVELLTALITNLPTIITTIVKALPQIITSIVNTLINSIPKIVETGVKLLTSLITNLPSIISTIVQAMPQIISGIVSALSNGVSQVAEVGKNLVRGLWDGIQSLASWLWSKVSNWISSIWDGITDFFGIHSPSTQMAWVGEMLVEGIAGAVETDGKKAVKAVGDMSEDMLDEVNSGLADVDDKLKDSLGEIETSISAKATIRQVTAAVPSTEDRRRATTDSGDGGTQITNTFKIAELVVREEADVKKISKELYNMQKTKSRGKGVVTA
jgi:phage-related protein